jgi:hypothetical protein
VADVAGVVALLVPLGCWRWCCGRRFRCPERFQAAAVLGVRAWQDSYLVARRPTAFGGAGVLSRLRQELTDPAALGLAADRAALEQLLGLIESWAPYLPGQVVSAALMVALLALLLGRWWQAGLFNPGGFRPEFQELRLGRPLAAGWRWLLFAARLVSHWPSLVNVALVLGTLYTLQGIAAGPRGRLQAAALTGLAAVFLLAAGSAALADGHGAGHRRCLGRFSEPDPAASGKAESTSIFPHASKIFGVG